MRETLTQEKLLARKKAKKIVKLIVKVKGQGALGGNKFRHKLARCLIHYSHWFSKVDTADFIKEYFKVQEQ